MTSLLTSCVHGYDHIEPVLVGLIATGRCVLLTGRHGVAKTRLARALGAGHPGGSVFYDATKDDLISVAGVPSSDSLQQGQLRFVAHERSIWDKGTVVIDEISRAGPETQNLWLEILEARTCFGRPLALRCVVATANPDGYAAAFRIDQALLDRFHAVVPVPEHQVDVDTATVEAIAQRALAPQASLTPEDCAAAFAAITAAEAQLLEQQAMERIIAWLGRVVPPLLGLIGEREGGYCSPRTYARNLPETVLATAAWYHATGHAAPLSAAAALAFRYCICTRLDLDEALCRPILEDAERALREQAPSDAGDPRVRLLAATGFDALLALPRQWRRWPSRAPLARWIPSMAVDSQPAMV